VLLNVSTSQGYSPTNTVSVSERSTQSPNWLSTQPAYAGCDGGTKPKPVISTISPGSTSDGTMTDPVGVPSAVKLKLPGSARPNSSLYGKKSSAAPSDLGPRSPNP
jgi:hypothetical protein